MLGRKPAVSQEEYRELITKYKERVVQDNKIRPCTDPIWMFLQNKLDGKVKAVSIYSVVVNNRYHLLDLIFGKQVEKRSEISNISQELLDDTQSSANNSSTEKTSIFFISFVKDEFDALITTTTRKITCRNKSRLRDYTILQKEKWTNIIFEKLFEATQLTHSFAFKSHYIFRDASGGNIAGQCKCGATIKCHIERNNINNIVKLRCVLKKGAGVCGKRQLRGTERKVVVEKLAAESTFAYRNKKALELIEKGDKNLVHLPSKNVYATAKWEDKVKSYLDKNPIIALSKLKRLDFSYHDVIHGIGYDPFFVHFWSAHQKRMYNEVVKEENACLAIDATGKVAQKIIHCDGHKSKHIFLYTGVVLCKSGIFPALRQLTESHHAAAISDWLKQWIFSGAIIPKEVVCDESRALLNAVTIAFTSFLTVEQYANACNPNTVPNCYIRIDCAHFLKSWSNFLYEKKVMRRSKNFYLSAVGSLILCREIATARKIVKSLLLISKSETIGDRTVALNEAINFILNLTTNEEVLEEEKESSNTVKNIISSLDDDSQNSSDPVLDSSDG